MYHIAATPRSAALAILVFLSSCGGGGGDGTTVPAIPAVSTIEVSPSAASLTPSETQQLTATLKDATGQALSGKTLTWTSSAPAQATVSNSGLVTAVSGGTATITATSEGKSGTALITVTVPVATVSVSAPSPSIVAEETLQLSAVPKDAGGTALTGRTITWTSSQTNVATVNGSGLVTGIAPGTSTLTATSEGKSGTVGLTVAAGVLVGTAGRTVTSDNGNIEILFPAGAVTSPTAITVTKVAQLPAALPAGARALAGAYEIGPAGVTFAQPITVKLKYDRNTLPAWAMSGDLSVQRSAGTQWAGLSDIVVDGNANTVSGKTTALPAFSSPSGRDVSSARAAGGSTQTIQVLNPHAVLNPASGSVNFQQRSANFSVSLVPRGAAIPPANVTQPTGNPGYFMYRWSTTGQNGSLGVGGKTTGWTTQSSMQYVATNPQLNQLTGAIDAITVEVLLNPAAQNNPGPGDIMSASASIDADLQVTYELTPFNRDLNRSQNGNYQVDIKDRQGNIVNLPTGQSIAWASSANFGSIPGNVPPSQKTITYTANSTFNSPTPRVDDVKATITRLETVTNRVPQWGGLLGLQLVGWQDQTSQQQRPVAELKSFATIKIPYTVLLTPANNNTLAPGGTKQFTVSLSPSGEIPAANLAYTFVNSATQGTLSVTNNTQTPSNQVTYTAATSATGGTDQIQVQALSILAGTVLETIGTGTATVQVDLLRANFSIFTQPTQAHPQGFVAARISIAKVPGASSYRVTATTSDGPYLKTFTGAETANVQAIGQVIDGGGVWHINLEAGFSSTQLGVDGRKAAYNNKYGNVVFSVQVTP